MRHITDAKDDSRIGSRCHYVPSDEQREIGDVETNGEIRSIYVLDDETEQFEFHPDGRQANATRLRRSEMFSFDESN
jgi:hypothetical protein